jgi:V-type H+-transporting ATPase subunit F
MARAAASEDGALLAVIADEDTITGFLLAGVGDVDLRRRSNFLVVDGKTTARAVEAAFRDFVARDDVAIVLVSQPIANMIRHAIESHDKVGVGARVCVGGGYQGEEVWLRWCVQ